MKRYAVIFLLLLTLLLPRNAYAVKGTCDVFGTFIPTVNSGNQLDIFSVAVQNMHLPFKDGGCNLGLSFEERLAAQEKNNQSGQANNNDADKKEEKDILAKAGGFASLDSMDFYVSVMGSAVCATVTVVTHSMFQVYCSILHAWTPVVLIMMVLYVLIYAISILFGINNITPKDASFRLVKISLIYLIATKPDLMVWWVYDVFTQTLISLFDVVNVSVVLNNPDPNVAKALATYSVLADGNVYMTNLFYNIDRLFALIVGDGETVAIMGVIGAVVFYVLGHGAFVFGFVLTGITASFMAFIRMLITFTTSFMGLVFVLMMAPIFISSLLFEKTKRLFNGWMASLLAYILQPLIIVVFLAMMGLALNLQQFSGYDYNPKIDPDHVYYYPDKKGKPTYRIKAIILKANHEFGEGSEKVTMEGPKLHQEWLDYFDCKGFANPTDCPYWDDIQDAQSKGDSYLGLSNTQKRVFQHFMGVASAWLVLNMIVSAFLSIIPKISRDLARWQGHMGTPALGGRSARLEEIERAGNEMGSFGSASVMTMEGTLQNSFFSVLNAPTNLPGGIGEKYGAALDAALGETGVKDAYEKIFGKLTKKDKAEKEEG